MTFAENQSFSGAWAALRSPSGPIWLFWRARFRGFRGVRAGDCLDSSLAGALKHCECWATGWCSRSGWFFPQLRSPDLFYCGD
jgi:hypothetical protein